MVAKALELRDKWLKHVNAIGHEHAALSAGKYNVARLLAA